MERIREIKGASIAHAKFEKVKVSDEYSRIVGIEEPVYDMLVNFRKKNVLRNERFYQSSFQSIGLLFPLFLIACVH